MDTLVLPDSLLFDVHFTGHLVTILVDKGSTSVAAKIAEFFLFWVC